MIIDARTLPSESALNADICIIGSGPAGITIAREFLDAKLRVIILEAGGLEYDRDSQNIYKGASVGLHYEDLDQARSRYFGGSSNCWAGFCRPLDGHDFEERPWVPNSGWPITRNDLQPFYQQAHKLLQLGPFEYDPTLWEKRIARADARLIRFSRDRVTNIIAQFSPPTRFGQTYRSELEHSSNVTVFLNATVTELESPGDGRTVTRANIRSLRGHPFHVVARIFILAAGGIENARLLLSSNRFQAGGIGNRHDVVGRYFMDHPRWRGGQMSFSDIRTNSGLYDLYGTYTGKIAVEGTKVAGFFGISPETQRAERIANTRCYVKSRFLGDSPQAAVAAQILFRGLYGRGPLRGRSRADLFKLARYLPQVAAIAIGMKYHSKRLHRGFVLETVFEPTPLPESRVTLRPDKDALGMQRVQVDWRLGELEKYTLRRTQQILAEEIKQESAGSVKINIPPEGDAWPNTLSGCWHHMGTTRMHSDPRRGVVDANCCVHDMKNLFIAGSSVFPTAGSDMPTITIVALALRLAEHIKHIRTAGET